MSENSKKKFLKKGRSHGQKIKLVRRKPGKRKCGICRAQMHGVPHNKARAQARKLSKTEKRPTAPFGGLLCTNCRTIVAEETAKVFSGKEIASVDLRYKPFVEQMLKKNN